LRNRTASRYAHHTPHNSRVLTGPDLLAKVRDLGQQPRDVIAIACGYTRKDGKPAFTAFFEALNAAHGLTLPPVSTAKPKKGKPLAWNVAVSKTGVIPVSAGYSAFLGLQPGDRVAIDHDVVGDSIILRKAPSVLPEAATSPVEAVPVVVTPATPIQAPQSASEPAAAPVRELAPF
jgi:hypothetical protein